MRKISHASVIISIIILVFLDQISKYYFLGFTGNEIQFIKPVINSGISFSILLPRMIILGISILAMIWFTKGYIDKKIPNLAYILLISGTLGNTMDRLIIGGVRDFLSFYSFPIFNFADTFLTIGITLYIINELLEQK